MTGRPAVARRATAGSAAALVVAASAVLAVQPAAAAATVPGSAVGPNGAVVTVESLRRTGSGLQLTVTVAARGNSPVTTAGMRHYWDQRPVVGAMVLDPATGRVGHTLGTVSDCRCTAFPFQLPVNTRTTVTQTLADPGGTTLDVLFDSFQPVPGVTVEGSSPASPASPDGDGIDTLHPRKAALFGRTAQGAAEISTSNGAARRIDLDTDVLFAFDSAQLTPASTAALKLAATSLEQQPTRRIGVYGHTDGKGAPGYNQALSLKRAQAVQAALAPLLGSGWTFDVQGLGATKPIAVETTAGGQDYPDGRARNRRVELAVLA